MDTLTTLLQRMPVARWGQVVCVGAGPDALNNLDAVDVARLVLIEGDPESSNVLCSRAAALRGRTSVHVVAQAVAVHAGPTAWNRYNLARLNGPLGAVDLTSVYPRLNGSGAQTVTAAAFADVLASSAPQPPTPKALPWGLVMDVPGQEATLLEALDDAVLQGFDWIALCGCAQRLADGWRPVGEASRRLRGAGFVAVPVPGDVDPLWPVEIHRFDPTGSERRDMLEQLAALRAERDACSAQRETLSKERDHAKHWHAESTAWAQKLKDEVDKLRAELQSARERSDSHERRADGAEAAHAKVLHQVAESHARQHLMDIELIKAEAQIELLKDILIREKNF